MSNPALLSSFKIDMVDLSMSLNHLCDARIICEEEPLQIKIYIYWFTFYSTSSGIVETPQK